MGAIKSLFKSILRPFVRPFLYHMRMITREELTVAQVVHEENENQSLREIMREELTTAQTAHEESESQSIREVMREELTTVQAAREINENQSIRTIMREELAAAHNGQCENPPPSTTLAPYLIDPAFFSKIGSEHKKKLFADNVECVDLETSSMCDRRCWFCPGSLIDSRHKQTLMDDAVFYKIIMELSDIDYDQALFLSYNNEPLMELDYAERRVRPARKILPKAYLGCNTNGDFLDKNKLSELADAGLDGIWVTLYIDYNIKTLFTYEAAEAAILQFGEKLGYIPDITTTPNEMQCVSWNKVGKIEVNVSAHNHRLYSIDKGNSLPADIPIPRRTERTRACCLPYFFMSISYDGLVMPCCNLRCDFEGHKELIAGDVKNNTIFEIFAGESFRKYRTDRLYNINTKPCDSCRYDGDTGLINTPFQPYRDRPRYRRTFKVSED